LHHGDFNIAIVLYDFDEHVCRDTGSNDYNLRSDDRHLWTFVDYHGESLSRLTLCGIVGFTLMSCCNGQSSCRNYFNAGPIGVIVPGPGPIRMISLTQQKYKEVAASRFS
jgi:hypothetical protein